MLRIAEAAAQRRVLVNLLVTQTRKRFDSQPLT